MNRQDLFVRSSRIIMTNEFHLQQSLWPDLCIHCPVSLHMQNDWHLPALKPNQAITIMYSPKSRPCI